MMLCITLYGFAARPLSPDSTPQPRDCAAVQWEALDAPDDYAFSSPQLLLRNALLTYTANESAGNVQTALSFEE